MKEKETPKLVWVKKGQFVDAAGQTHFTFKEIPHHFLKRYLKDGWHTATKVEADEQRRWENESPDLEGTYGSGEDHQG